MMGFKNTGNTTPGPQLVFDLAHRAAMGIEDFLITPSNRQAVDAIDAWPQWPHHTLALVGPRASGKTHLASVWRTSSNAIVKSIASLNINSVPEFLSRRAVVIEDVGEDKFDESALFHLLNMAGEGKTSVLLTSLRPPAHWAIDLPDLASRLRALPLAQLYPPDDVLLRAVLVKLLFDRQLLVDEAVINYLIQHMERSIASAAHVVADLDQAALARKVKITRRLAKEVLETRSRSKSR